MHLQIVIHPSKHWDAQHSTLEKYACQPCRTSTNSAFRCYKAAHLLNILALTVVGQHGLLGCSIYNLPTAGQLESAKEWCRDR